MCKLKPLSKGYQIIAVHTILDVLIYDFDKLDYCCNLIFYCTDYEYKNSEFMGQRIGFYLKKFLDVFNPFYPDFSTVVLETHVSIRLLGDNVVFRKRKRKRKRSDLVTNINEVKICRRFTVASVLDLSVNIY